MTASKHLYHPLPNGASAGPSTPPRAESPSSTPKQGSYESDVEVMPEKQESASLLIHSKRESEESFETRHDRLRPCTCDCQTKSRRKWFLAMLGFAFIVMEILYFTIPRRRPAVLGWTDDLQGLPAAQRPVKQLNASSITTHVSREQLLGDSRRYLGSNRDFEICHMPTTRVFNWTISEALAAPGAMEKPMILVNGMSPGPVLEANLGDRVIINVFNNCSNETSMHWHGQYLRGENFMDGTYGITQCGIPPGRTMTYNWTVQNVGTSWYHAHKLASYTDGQYGPIILHAPNETAMTANHYDDEYTFLLNDMYNTQASALEWRFKAIGTGIDGQPGDEPVPDGGMINGVSQARCAFIPNTRHVIPERRRMGKRGLRSYRNRANNEGVYHPETNYCGDLPVTYFNATLVGNKTYRLRLVNSGTFLNTRFSIDNHPLTIIEADGISVEPKTVSSIDIGTAQRYSVLVTLNQTAGAYWIRNRLDTGMARYIPRDLEPLTLGVLRYEGVDPEVMPRIPAGADAADLPGIPAYDSLDNTQLTPADKLDAELPTQSAMVHFGMQYTWDNQHYHFFNRTAWTPLGPGESAMTRLQNLGSSLSAIDALSTNDSAMAQLREGELGSQLSIVNAEAGVFDLIINSLDDGNHPFHLHGHTFQVMAQGPHYFSGDSAELNTENPMRRDTVIVPSYGHLVLRFKTDNPGIWAFHCHIAWHMENGLLMTITNLPDQVARFEIPQGNYCSIDRSLGW